MTDTVCTPSLTTSRSLSAAAAPLNFAGGLYIVGDLALALAGKMKNDPEQSKAGLLYLAAGAAPMLFGKENPEKQLNHLQRDLRHYLEKQNVDIPKIAALNRDEVRSNGLISHLESFMYKYPSQILNAFYGLGSMQLYKSGINKGDKWQAASGALVIAGALLGLIIPEEAPKKDHKPANMFEAAWQWAKEKPLRVSSMFYMANNFTLARSAYQDYKNYPGNNAYLLKTGTVACYVLANILLGLSSKQNNNTSEEKGQILEALECSAAEVIAAQPKALQEQIIQQVAGYLSAEPKIGIAADDIANAIRQKVRGEKVILPVKEDAIPTNWAARMQSAPTHAPAQLI